MLQEATGVTLQDVQNTLNQKIMLRRKINGELKIQHSVDYFGVLNGVKNTLAGPIAIVLISQSAC